MYSYNDFIQLNKNEPELDATQRLINKYNMFCHISGNLLRSTEYFYKNNSNDDIDKLHEFLTSIEFKQRFSKTLDNIVAISGNIDSCDSNLIDDD